MAEKFQTSRVAILASGGGSTAEAFIRATQDKRVDAEVGLVVCNNPPEKAAVHDRVERLNEEYGLDIQTLMINGRTHPGGSEGRGQTLEESEAICAAIDEGSYDHVALMGYMKQVRGALVDEYGWLDHFDSVYQARMTNTHPGPLPETGDTYGIHTQERVLQLRLKMSKHTLHVVSAGIDRGPIVAEHPVELRGDDTPESLFSRLQVVEKENLPIAIHQFLKDQQAHFSQTEDR